jgi:hypothetical protein
VYLGSEDAVATRWNRKGLFLIRRRDFYVCSAYYTAGPVFKSRFGHAPDEHVVIPGEHLERWDVRAWTAQAATDSSDHSVPLKALQMLYRDRAIERGFAVYRHPQNDTSAYVLMSPVLAPSEHQLLSVSMERVFGTLSRERSGCGHQVE